MCEISTVAPDWVIKGLHLHVRQIEVRISPDDKGQLSYHKVFDGTPDDEFQAAVKLVVQFLQDAGNRQRLYDALGRAIEFVQGDSTRLRRLALGRGAEFTFLRHALRRMGLQ